MLIIGGTKNRITPLNIQIALEKKYQANAKLITIDGACHWTVSGNHLAKIENTILNWLDNQTPSTAV